jgi:hypothetical protein
MKLKIYYIGIVLMFFAATAINAQDQQQILKRNADGTVADEKPATVNPAKIDPATQVDLKVDPNQRPASPTNWKPGTTPADDRKSMEPQKTAVPVINTQPAGAHQPSQPAGLQPPAKPANQQKVNTDKTQPEGAKAPATVKKSNATVPMTQPEGAKPQAVKSR